MANPEYMDLHSLCPGLPEDQGYCSTSLQGPRYTDWERNIATPSLEKLGYTVGRWYTGEKDSFGPLSRLAIISKDGTTSIVRYG